MTKKQSSDLLGDFIIQVFAIIKSKSDNTILEFNTAD